MRDRRTVHRGEAGDAGELGTGSAETRRPGPGAAGADREGPGDCAEGVGGSARRVGRGLPRRGGVGASPDLRLLD